MWLSGLGWESGTRGRERRRRRRGRRGRGGRRRSCDWSTGGGEGRLGLVGRGTCRSSRRVLWFGVEGWFSREVIDHCVEEARKITSLALTLPVLHVFQIASTTDVDSPASLDDKVCGWDYIHDRRVARILPGDPSCNGDIVLCTTIADG